MSFVFLHEKDFDKPFFLEFFNVGKRDDIVTKLQNNTNFKYSVLDTMFSFGENMYKLDSKIYTVEKYNQTPLIQFQCGIDVLGYNKKEVMIENNSWGDLSDLVEFKIKSEKVDQRQWKSVKKTIHIFTSQNCIIKIDDTTFITEVLDKDIESAFQYTIYLIFTNYYDIMSREEEKIVQIAYQTFLPLDTRVFQFHYVPKMNKHKKGILVNDYVNTIPCIYKIINGISYLLDLYGNLLKFGIMEGMETEYCFYNIRTEQLTCLHEIEDTISLHNPRGCAIIHYNKSISSFEIFTLLENIYIDDIKDNVFTRYIEEYSCNSFLFLKKAMTLEQKNSIEKVIDNIKLNQIIINFYTNLDPEKLSYLSEKEVLMITKQLDQKDSPKYTVVKNFLLRFFKDSYKVDDTKAIVCLLDSTVSKDLIKPNAMYLEKRLCDSKLKNELFLNTDTYKEEYFGRASSVLDQFKNFTKFELEKQLKYKNTKAITNSWLKCWEMLHIFNLIPDKHASDFTVFCNGEFPGSFIYAIHHYIKTKTSNKQYKWFANSLMKTTTPFSGFSDDKFDLFKHYQKQWTMNEHCSGDITDKNTINYIKKLTTVDLYTSDASIYSSIDDCNNQEMEEGKLFLSQLLCGMTILKDGGHMVCKLSTFFKPSTISALSLLCVIFESVHITKPIASRPVHSECYVVCKNYTKKINLIHTMERVIENWDMSSIMSFFFPVSREFYMTIMEASYMIYEKQIRYMQQTLESIEILHKVSPKFDTLFKNFYKYDKPRKELELRKLIVDSWKKQFPIPDLDTKDQL